MSLITRLFPPLGREEFASMLMEEVRRLGETDARLDEAAFQVRLASGPVDLDRPYASLGDVAPWQRRNELRRVVADMLAEALPREWEQARAGLLPRVRDAARLSLEALQARLAVDDLPATTRLALSDDLVVEVVYDTPMRAIPVDDLTLEGWGVGFEEALAQAGRNLLHLQEIRFESDGHVHACASTDGHDAARLLLWREFRDLAAPGGLVAAVPNRELLLLAGADDLDHMVGRMAAALEVPGALSPFLLRLGEEGWTGFEAPAESLRELQVRHRVRQFGQQEALLKQIASREPDPPAVTPCLRLDEAPRTCCEWREGRPALLPRTDLVRLAQADGTPLGTFEWSRVWQVAGYQMEPLRDVYPVRYRVRSFPTADEIRRLN